MANDESLDEPEPIPAIPESLDHDRKPRQKLKENLRRIKTRRGYGNKNKNKEWKSDKTIQFSLLGANANGIQSKKESLNEITSSQR